MILKRLMVMIPQKDAPYTLMTLPKAPSRVWGARYLTMIIGVLGVLSSLMFYNMFGLLLNA